MPIYNNPAIGQAFENLAGMFAPPSGADAAGWASANAKNAEAKRIADFFAAADTLPTDAYDRRGAALGIFNPTQGFGARDMANAATLRGQDISSADSRYGTDIAAQTSRANNAADNIRAQYGIDVGSADARYGTDVAARTSVANNAANNAGAMARQMASPIAVNRDQRVFLPAQTAAATGLDPQLDGAASPLSLDETTAAVFRTLSPADQRQLTIDKFAIGESEQKARERQALIANGTIDNSDIESLIMSENPLEKIVGPDGKPTFSTRAGAVGKEAAVNEGAQAAPQLRNYQTQDGRNGNAVYDNARGTWVDTTTKTPLPEGSTLYTGELSGGGAETGFGPQKPNLVAATNLEASLDSAQQLTNNLREILKSSPNVAGVPGRIKGIAQSLTSSANQVLGAYGAELPIDASTLQKIKAAAAAASPPGSPGYDANIVRLQSGLYDLAYMRAQINNPTGEVSRQAFDRSMESLGQSMLSSQEDLMTALDAFDQDTIAIGRTKVQSLRGQRDQGGPVSPTAAEFQSTVAPAAAQPAAPKRKRYDATTGTVR